MYFSAGCVSMRGDVGRSEARSMAEDALHHNRIRPPGETRHTRLFRKQFMLDPNIVSTSVDSSGED